jgi:predicted PurR-regulated permease PerM
MMTVAQGLATGVSAFVLVIVAAVFLALGPGAYRDGMILLVPRSWHDKLRLGLEKTGDGLRLWLQAQLLAMITVGVLVGGA